MPIAIYAREVRGNRVIDGNVSCTLDEVTRVLRARNGKPAPALCAGVVCRCHEEAVTAGRMICPAHGRA